MAKKKFQTESKQLLNLMIHSIYSTKDIFMRELISNASDALDKRAFYALQNKDDKYDELKINLEFNKKNKTIIIKDNGIGMDENDLENNLGTIAKSGSKEFVEMLEKENKTNNEDVIGQFGVGFYSSFIVADKVEVFTKKLNNKGLKWISDGVEDYSIEEIEKEDIGTEIILYLKEDKEIIEFLDQYKIQEIVKNYSDYIKYPIYMDFEETRYEKESDEEDAKEKEVKEVVNKVLNSQKAIWKKDKKDVTKEEYNDFYKNKYYDHEEPALVIHSKAEGTLNYELLLFIPKNKPFDYDSPNSKKGIDLYSKGILIDHTLDYLLPSAFSFVKGLVDSQDLNLNISREMLQKDTVVSKLMTNIQNKIKKELMTMLKKRREDYEQLINNFGRTLVYGMYEEFGKDKELVKDLVMFKSNKEDKYTTFKEYIERNKEQKEIYYVSGSSIDKIKQMPTIEKINQKGIEVLYFLNDIDEFAIQVLQEYDGKQFKSITDASIDLSTEEEKKEIENKTKDSEDLLTNLKEILKDDVSDIKLTNKLVDSAVAITNEAGLSLEMEKVLSQMPGAQAPKAKKVLELNPEHELFTSLNKVKDNKEELTKYGKLLFQQALLSEGLPLDNPREYAKLLDELIIKATK